MPYKTPEQQRKRNQEYRAKHREEILAQQRKHWQDNKEYYKALNKKYRDANKEKLSLKAKLKRQEHPEIEREKHRKYYLANKEKISAKRKEYRKTHLPPIRIYNAEYYNNNKDKLKAKSIKYRTALKIDVLTHYGNGKCACVRCGYSDIRALTLDHINGGGHQQRRDTGKSGLTFYIWLKQKGYPSGLQTYCCNCQFLKRSERSEYRTNYPRKTSVSAVIAQ